MTFDLTALLGAEPQCGLRMVAIRLSQYEDARKRPKPV